MVTIVPFPHIHHLFESSKSTQTWMFSNHIPIHRSRSADLWLEAWSLKVNWNVVKSPQRDSPIDSRRILRPHAFSTQCVYPRSRSFVPDLLNLCLLHRGELVVIDADVLSSMRGCQVCHIDVFPYVVPEDIFISDVSENHQTGERAGKALCDRFSWTEDDAHLVVGRSKMRYSQWPEWFIHTMPKPPCRWKG